MKAARDDILRPYRSTSATRVDQLTMKSKATVKMGYGFRNTDNPISLMPEPDIRLPWPGKKL